MNTSHSPSCAPPASWPPVPINQVRISKNAGFYLPAPPSNSHPEVSGPARRATAAPFLYFVSAALQASCSLRRMPKGRYIPGPNTPTRTGAARSGGSVSRSPRLDYPRLRHQWGPYYLDAPGTRNICRGADSNPRPCPRAADATTPSLLRHAHLRSVRDNSPGRSAPQARGQGAGKAPEGARPGRAPLPEASCRGPKIRKLSLLHPVERG